MKQKRTLSIAARPCPSRSRHGRTYLGLPLKAAYSNKSNHRDRLELASLGHRDQPLRSMLQRQPHQGPRRATVTAHVERLRRSWRSRTPEPISLLDRHSLPHARLPTNAWNGAVGSWCPRKKNVKEEGQLPVLSHPPEVRDRRQLAHFHWVLKDERVLSHFDWSSRRVRRRWQDLDAGSLFSP